MTRLHPRFLLPLLRVVVLGVLALGLAFAHSHGPHANDPGAEFAAADAHDQDGSETLHLLLDFAHYCGSAAAVLPVLDSFSTRPVAGRMGVEKASPPAALRLPSPFKPPIFG